MKRNRQIAVALTFVLLAAAPGCGSSSGGSPDGGGGGLGGASGNGTFRWKEAGTQHTASFAAAAGVKSANLDMVQVTGSNANSEGVSFGVGMMTPPLVAGGYACSDSATVGSGRIVSIAYTLGAASSLAPTCAITVTTLGETTGTRVTGTFSATVPFDDGTTHTITDGVYDVSLTVSSL
jgi:hypothetical protein